MGAVLEPTSVSVSSGEDKVVFEMVDTRTVDLVDARKVPPPRFSAVCDLMLSSTRLSLLQLQRQRKTRLVGRSARRVSVISSTLPLLSFASTVRRLQAIFHTFTEALRSAGISSTVSLKWALEGGSKYLAGEQGPESFGCLLCLDIQGW